MSCCSKIYKCLKLTAAVHFVFFGVLPFICGTWMVLSTTRSWHFEGSLSLQVAGLAFIVVGLCLISFAYHRKKERLEYLVYSRYGHSLHTLEENLDRDGRQVRVQGVNKILVTANNVIDMAMGTYTIEGRMGLMGFCFEVIGIIASLYSSHILKIEEMKEVRVFQYAGYTLIGIGVLAMTFTYKFRLTRNNSPLCRASHDRNLENRVLVPYPPKNDGQTNVVMQIGPRRNVLSECQPAPSYSVAFPNSQEQPSSSSSLPPTYSQAQATTIVGSQQVQVTLPDDIQ